MDKKSVKPACKPDSVHRSCPRCDRHSSGPLVAQAARCYLPAHHLRGSRPSNRSELRPSWCAYLVLLRAEIARFTRTESARLCCSDPHLMPGACTPRFQWTAVSCCAALCSPDVPPVRPFGTCTSGGPAGFTLRIINDPEKHRIAAQHLRANTIPAACSTALQAQRSHA
jgi:hypothetical protein